MRFNPLEAYRSRQGPSKDTSNLKEAIRKNPEDSALGFLAALVVISAITLNAPRFVGQTTSAEPNITAPPTATVTKQEEEQILRGLTAYFTTLDHIEIAQALLRTPGLDMDALSFEEQMQEKNYFLDGFETWGTVARSGTTGENGTSIKRVPSPDNEQFPPVGGVPPKTKLSWIAEISVVNPDGLKETFGLSTSPEITKSLEKLEGPNVLVVRDPYSQRDVYCQIEPRYLRLEHQNPDGSVTRFVNREERQTFEDGSINYGAK